MKVTYEAPDEVSVMLHSGTNNQQDASGRLTSTHLIVTLPVNGRDYHLSVAESSPSTVALSRIMSKSQVSSKRDTTAPTKTRSTTSRVTSTASATDATTAGTPLTTPTTTPTSVTPGTKQEQYAADAKAGLTHRQIAEKHGVTTGTVSTALHRYNKRNNNGASKPLGRPVDPAVAIRNKLMYKDQKAGLTISEIAEKYDVSMSTVSLAIGKLSKEYKERMAKARAKRNVHTSSN